MYMVHELRGVTENRQSETVTRISWIARLLPPKDGFVRALCCRYLGSADQYVWMRAWRDKDAYTAFRATDEGINYSKNRPVGWYGNLPGGIGAGMAWQSVLEAGDGNAGNFLVRGVYKVAPGKDAAFVANRKEHDAAALKVPGVHSVVTFQCQDENAGDIYLTLLRTDSRATYDAMIESAGMTAYRDSLPEGLYERLAAECYDVVDQTTPATPALTLKDEPPMS